MLKLTSTNVTNFCSHTPLEYTQLLQQRVILSAMYVDEHKQNDTIISCLIKESAICKLKKAYRDETEDTNLSIIMINPKTSFG